MDEKLKPCPCKTGEDYSEIWLAPRCDEESGDGRLWCKDAFVFEPCPDCNGGPVKYVRADLFESARASGYAAGIADAAALLTEALPLVEQAEFLLDRQSYSYGCDPTEPSPPEWGVTVGYQQFRPDQSPHDMFLEDVEQFHRENRDEDDGSGEHLTVANKIGRALSTNEKGEAK